MTRKDFDLGTRDRTAELSRRMPPDTIVGSQGISVSQDQDACHRQFPRSAGRQTSSRTLPDASSNWTRSGISPNACVEQLKQGS